MTGCGSTLDQYGGKAVVQTCVSHSSGAQSGTLPFTGIDLFFVVIVAVIAIAAGLLGRLTGR